MSSLYIYFYWIIFNTNLRKYVIIFKYKKVKGDKRMVEAFKIVGGNKIAGELKVDGSKNSTLPIMIATLLEKGTYILWNVPDLRDIRTLVALL